MTSRERCARTTTDRRHERKLLEGELGERLFVVKAGALRVLAVADALDREQRRVDKVLDARGLRQSEKSALVFDMSVCPTRPMPTHLESADQVLSLFELVWTVPHRCKRSVGAGKSRFEAGLVVEVASDHGQAPLLDVRLVFEQ